MIMTELLAPCGDVAALRAAVSAGADAVYLGLSDFNARMRAENFTKENLRAAVEYCHLFGVKVYVAVNTAVKQQEISKLNETVLTVKAAKADAIIVSDLAAVFAAKRLAPEIPVHVSTQAGVCNAEAAEFYEQLGATRVILSREATLDDVKEIKRRTKLEIECFVQGALCVAFSGKCLLSSIVNGGSGNRGRCLQPCRLNYRDDAHGREGYLLSTADLCLSDKLAELSAAGVISFKIEGRLRKTDYVYKTVSVYRRIIDNNFVSDNADKNKLQGAFNRGNFTEGYAFTDDVMSIKVQGNVGVFCGKVSFVDKNGYSRITTKYPLSIGLGYKLLDVNGVEKGGGKVLELKKSTDGFLVKLEGARVGDSLQITSEVAESIIEKKLPIKVDFFVDEGYNACLTLSYNGISVTEKTIFCAAEKAPLTADGARANLTKFGDTPFTVDTFNTTITSSAFATVAKLNEMRRTCVEKLKNEMINAFEGKNVPINTKMPTSIMKNEVIHNNLTAIELQDVSQLTEYSAVTADYIVYSPKVFSVADTDSFVCRALSINENARVFLKLTPNARHADVLLFEKILKSLNNLYGVYCDNNYAVVLAEKYGKRPFFGFGLNVFNSETADFYGSPYCASVELNRNELQNMPKAPFVFSYGYLPLMTLSHCVEKLTGGDCAKCTYRAENVTKYVDRKNYAFEIVRNKAKYCYFTLYNSVIADLSAKVCAYDFNFYLNMLKCSASDVDRVLRAFSEKIPLDTKNATSLHFLRGVD